MTEPATEADFQQAVIQTARLLGFRCAHFAAARTKHGWKTPARADGKGFPDMVLVGRGRVIFAELKREGGKLSPEQAEWLAALKDAGAEVFCWFPDMWESIVETLSGHKVRTSPLHEQARSVIE